MLFGSLDLDVAFGVVNQHSGFEVFDCGPRAHHRFHAIQPCLVKERLGFFSVLPLIETAASATVVVKETLAVQAIQPLEPGRCRFGTLVRLLPGGAIV